jgi:hypothetical protein
MFNFTDSQIRGFERVLLDTPKALQFAQKNTINDLAFGTRKLGQENARSQMTLRNKWTEGSIQVDRAKKLTDPAVVGSTRDYMAKQEFGGSRDAQGGRSVPIPTSYATGEGISANPRTRTARPRNRLDKLQLNGQGIRGKNRKQTTLLRVREAVKTRRREIYLDLGRKQGIFRVIGGSPRTGRGWPKGAKLRMLYDLSRSTTPVPRNPWLEPATDRAVLNSWQIYGRRAQEQVDRLEARLS